jgi:hypothetical protein
LAVLTEPRVFATATIRAQAFNENEEAEHAMRWDGFEPMPAVEAAGKADKAAASAGKADRAAEALADAALAAAATAAAAAEQQSATLEETATAPSEATEALAGEGGRRMRARRALRERRLADVSGHFTSEEERAASWKQFQTADTVSDTDDLAFSLTASNTYSRKTNGYSGEYPWQVVAEPYRTTTLAVVERDSDDGSTAVGATYRWTVDGHVHGFGSSVAVAFSEVGYHVVAVERLAASTATVAPKKSFASASADSSAASPSLSASDLAAQRLSLSLASGSAKVVTKVMCKYVRREVRSLSDADREAWLSAVQVLQHVPTSAGQVRPRLFISRLCIC